MSVKCSYCDETRIARCAFIECPVDVDERDATISQLQAEVERMREALKKIADVSEYRDGIGLCQFRPAMSAELAQETAYQALFALGGSNDKG